MVRIRCPELDARALKKNGEPCLMKMERGYVLAVDDGCADRDCLAPMRSGDTGWVCRNNRLFGCPEFAREERRAARRERRAMA
jgi:hypothetical protein